MDFTVRKAWAEDGGDEDLVAFLAIVDSSTGCMRVTASAATQLSEQQLRRTSNLDNWRTTENSSIRHEESLHDVNHTRLQQSGHERLETYVEQVVSHQFRAAYDQCCTQEIVPFGETVLFNILNWHQNIKYQDKPEYIVGTKKRATRASTIRWSGTDDTFRDLIVVRDTRSASGLVPLLFAPALPQAIENQTGDKLERFKGHFILVVIINTDWNSAAHE